MSDFDANQNVAEGHSHRSQREKQALSLLSDLSKGLDVQHHNTSLLHQFGGAFEAPVAVAENSSAVGFVGFSDSPARSDHRHAAETPVWQTPTLLNSWANFGAGYQTARYTIIGGVVHIQGLITGTVGNVAFVLNSGFRPGSILIFSVEANFVLGRLDVSSNGNVVPISGNNGYFSISCSFIPG